MKGKDVGLMVECIVLYVVVRYVFFLVEVVLVGVGMKNGCCVVMCCVVMLGDKCCR